MKYHKIILGLGALLIITAGYFAYRYIKIVNAEQPLDEQTAIDDTEIGLQDVDTSVLDDVTQEDVDDLPRGNTEVAGGGDAEPDVYEKIPAYMIPSIED